jgi:acetyltransferase-like isoleucine patch superfamily enzyme
MGKCLKWCASAARVACAKIRLGSRLFLPRGGKPVYLGRAARLDVAPDGVMVLGSGVYIDDLCRLQVLPGARMELSGGCYFNTNCRVVAADSVCVGGHTMFGPNACVFDHDHVFDSKGVHGGLVSSPIEIGDCCWLGANVLVTKGVHIADRICIGGGSAVTRDLEEPGIYVGAPACLVRRTFPEGGGVDGAPGTPQEAQARDGSAQAAQRAVAAPHLQGQGEGA